MRVQKLVALSNLKQINKLLSDGYEFNHLVGSKHCLLSKYFRNNERDSQVEPDGIVGNSMQTAVPTRLGRGF